MLQGGVDFEAILAELARSNKVADGNLTDVLKFIAARAAAALNVRRVSVWKFDARRSALDCLLLHDAEDSGATNERLLAADHPVYFAAIKQLRAIAAVDAASDPRTIELRESYLEKHQITTTLDAPIFRQGETVGVVCHEHCCTAREWTKPERMFAAAVADLISLAVETAERIEVEKKLAEADNLLETVAREMSDSFTLLERGASDGDEFVFSFVNRAASERYGFAPAEVLGKPATFNIAAESQAQFIEHLRRAFDENAANVAEVQALHRDGAIKTVEIIFNPVRHRGREMVAVIGRDITARRAAESARLDAERKRLQAQRLESLGLLAGKVAHDFNNLLVGILGNAALAARNLPLDNDKARRFIANIETSVQIAADLTAQLLAFSGQQKLDFAPTDLAALVGEMLNLLRVSLPPGVRLDAELGDDVPEISAEQTQLRQTVMNLVLNAADATAASSGAIRIRVGSEVLTADRANANFDLQAEDFAALAADRTTVCLVVADDGAGMDEQTKSRIFEPFFTTKENGHGLGLAALGGVVRAHRGAVKVESAPGAGTTFTIYFPVFDRVSAADKTISE